MDWLVRHKKYILKLIVTCNWNHPGWPFLTINFFNGHIIDYENQYNSKCALLRVLSLQVQQSRGKLLKVSFTEASMRTSDSKSTISYLFYTTYVLQSLQMLTSTQITSVQCTYLQISMYTHTKYCLASKQKAFVSKYKHK